MRHLECGNSETRATECHNYTMSSLTYCKEVLKGNNTLDIWKGVLRTMRRIVW